jgi:hypothetical protein
MSKGSPGGEIAAFDRGAGRPRPGSDNCIPLRLGRRERAQDLLRRSKADALAPCPEPSACAMFAERFDEAVRYAHRVHWSQERNGSSTPTLD